MNLSRLVRSAVLDAWAVLAPIDCSGCGAPDLALCAACRAALAPRLHASQRGGVVVWSALDYSGVARRVIGSFKDGGRTDAASALAAPLRAAVAAALADAAQPAVAAQPAGAGSAAGDEGVCLVTIPSSRRSWRIRGYHPVDLLLRRAGLAPTRVLRQRGNAADQVGLGREARSRNKRGSLVARGGLGGFRCIVVDDVLTTGATVLEARRAVHEAGGEVLGVATLAETRRRFPVAERSQETG